MSQQNATESFEIERKYEVGAETRLPAAAAFAAAGLTSDAPERHELLARYFDTPDGALARLGLAMRERRGGKDAGWHLKQKGADGARELLWPPAERMPDGLLAELRERIGDAAETVAPIARLQTERVVVRLRNAAGIEVVELADDTVRAEDGRTGVLRAWREWEAELMPDADPALLDLVEPLLLAAGAAESLSVAKIARATGRLVEIARAKGASADIIAELERLDAADQAAARRLAP